MVLKGSSLQRKQTTLDHFSSCEEMLQLAGHDLRTPLTSFHLQMRILRDLICLETCQDRRSQMLHVCQNSEKQIQRMERTLDHLVHTIETEFFPPGSM